MLRWVPSLRSSVLLSPRVREVWNARVNAACAAAHAALIFSSSVI